MIFEGKFLVEAPREKVWDFLWDTEKVSKCMPGVIKVEENAEGASYSVLVKTKVGFLSTTFDLAVRVLEKDPPQRISSLFEGKDSRIASRIKQVNTMELIEVSDSQTEVGYKSEVTLTGKLATLGLSIVKGKAKQLLTAFGDNIKKEIEESKIEISLKG